MATQVQFRRGSTAQVAAATPAAGEIVVDTDKDTVVVGDGSTAGGFELARVDGSNWAITNAISTTANISFGDNDKAIFGAGSDLQIYHSGSASIIEDTGTGDLVIKGTDLYLRNASNSNRLYAGTDTRLYYDGSEKIRTTSTGIDVTGTVNADGLTVQTAQGDITIPTSTSSLNFARAGSNYIRATDASGSFTFITGANDFATQRMKLASNGDISFYNSAGTSQSLFWDASAESLGIGTSSPSSKLAIHGSADDAYFKQTNSANSQTLEIGNAFSLYSGASGGVSAIASDSVLAFATADTERMRIDSSGNALFGTTNTAPYATSTTGGMVFRNDFDLLGLSRGSNYALSVNRYGTDGDLVNFRKNGTTVGSIGVDNSDNLYIQGNSTHGGLQFGTSSVVPHQNGALSGDDIDLGSASTRFKNLYLSGIASVTTTVENGTAQFKTVNANTAPASEQFYVGNNLGNVDLGNKRGALKFFTGTTEKIRLDTSGNLLVGKTSADNTTQGIRLYPTGRASIVADDDTALIANRLTGHGAIVDFHKDSVRHGRLGTGGSYFFIAGGTGGSTHSGIRFVNDSSQRPCTNSGGNLDNTVTWGASAARWEEIFSVNGTINTSDRNEKQDIEALSDAEQRVAVAAKGLMRKYRWRNAVAAKGDDARIHFGIIAQDLQDAFTAEGLDAARYAMWCSDTFWVDSEGETYDTQEEAPEGATEKTRLGVRYSELLAFIIAAI